MEKLLFIYNPQAGKGEVQSKLSAILDVFTKKGWLTTVYPTQSKGDASAIAKELGSEFSRVVCCGGDGTLHETVAGLMTLSKRPELGYIPAGTTNDYSRNLALPKGLENLAGAAAGGCPRAVDVGSFNGRHFVYVAAFGAFTDVAYDTPQTFKNLFGHGAYVLQALSKLGNLKSYRLRVEHDGGSLEEDFLFGMVSNTVSVGGVLGLPAETVALDDGLLEAVLVRTPKNGGELNAALGALMRQTADEKAGVYGLHSAKITLMGEKSIPWTLDGEYGGEAERAEILVCPKAVTIVYGA